MELTLENIKIKVKEEKPCQITFSVSIPSPMVHNQQAKVEQEFQKVAQLPGFRVGKVPIELIRKNYAGKVKSEALDQILKTLVPRILKEKVVHPVVTPYIEKIESGKDESFSFNLIVEHSPNFKLKNYTGISVEKKVKKIKDEDVSKELDQLRERNARLVPSEAKKASQSHFAIVDYSAACEGKPLPEFKGENQLIDLNSPQTLQGFSEGIIGMSKEESKDIAIEFPKESPQKEIAGKSVVFNVVLKDLKEKNAPPLNDDFAKDFGLESLEILKNKVRESLGNWAVQNTQSELEKDILDSLVEINPISVPDSLVAFQLESLIDQALGKKSSNQDESEEEKEKRKPLREKYRGQAERLVRVSYLMGGIADQEKLHATEDDFKQEQDKALESNPEKADQVKQYFEKNQSRILNRITEDKVIKFLIDHAKIKEITI